MPAVLSGAKPVGALRAAPLVSSGRQGSASNASAVLFIDAASESGTNSTSGALRLASAAKVMLKSFVFSVVFCVFSATLDP